MHVHAHVGLCTVCSCPLRPQDHLDEPGACFARTAAGVTVALPQGEAVTEWRHKETSEAPGAGASPSSATDPLHLTFAEWREIPLKEADGKSSGRLAVAAKGLVRGGGGALEAGRCGALSSPAPRTLCTLRTCCTLSAPCRYALCADFVVRPAAAAAAAAAGAQAVELRGGFARVAAAESETLRYKTLMKSLVGTAVTLALACMALADLDPDFGPGTPHPNWNPYPILAGNIHKYDESMESRRRQLLLLHNVNRM